MTAGAAPEAPSPVGFVTGLRDESLILERRLPAAPLACAGADSGRARAAALRLVEAGVGALVSFGVAGGLDPDLRPGDLLLAEAVVFEDRRWPCDAAWRGRVAAQLAGHKNGMIAGSPGELASAADKARLFRESGASAVDMESHAVAAVAAVAGLPFLALRAIADPAGLSLPRAVLGAIDAEGRSRTGLIVGRLAFRPWELPALLALGRHYGHALRALEKAAAASKGGLLLT